MTLTHKILLGSSVGVVVAPIAMAGFPHEIADIRTYSFYLLAIVPTVATALAAAQAKERKWLNLTVVLSWGTAILLEVAALCIWPTDAWAPVVWYVVSQGWLIGALILAIVASALRYLDKKKSARDNVNSADSSMGVRQHTMPTFDRITLRPVKPSDLDAFYVHQLDPEAIRMAAFVSADRKNRPAFDAHWTKILNASQNINRTIVADGQVAGHIACFPLEGKLEVTYWLGREFWGKGVATQALHQMLQLVNVRPLFARAASDNLGSLRVLQKCGFKIIGTDNGFAHGRGADTEEYILRLDPDLNT